MVPPLGRIYKFFLKDRIEIKRRQYGKHGFDGLVSGGRFYAMFFSVPYHFQPEISWVFTLTHISLISQRAHISILMICFDQFKLDHTGGIVSIYFIAKLESLHSLRSFRLSSFSTID
jgi:hypothetical protein